MARIPLTSAKKTYIYIINNVPINEIELNRMASTRKKAQLPTTHQPVSCSCFFFVSPFFGFRLVVVVYFKICNFLRRWRYTLQSAHSQSGWLTIFVCVSFVSVCVQRCQYFTTSFSRQFARVLGNWLICSVQCGVWTHSFVNSFVTRGRACNFFLPFDASILIKNRMDSHFSLALVAFLLIVLLILILAGDEFMIWIWSIKSSGLWSGERGRTHTTQSI